MSKRAINSPTLTAEEWSAYLTARRDRRAHPRPVMLTGGQVGQIAEIMSEIREISFLINMLIEFPEEWNERLGEIRSTASRVRYAAKAPRQRLLPPVDAGLAGELLQVAADD